MAVTLAAVAASLWLIYRLAAIVPQQEMARQPFAFLKFFFSPLFSFTYILVYYILYRHSVGQLELRWITQAGEMSDVLLSQLSAELPHHCLGRGAGLCAAPLVAGTQESLAAMNLCRTTKNG